ncbi:MAG: hypothetical protein BWY77_01035 [bacterium ADurb.Bin431]|nr:MAG: hypothetical protein BWY77_01035 [bacterium ADurb.Bin431]
MHLIKTPGCARGHVGPRCQQAILEGPVQGLASEGGLVVDQGMILFGVGGAFASLGMQGQDDAHGRAAGIGEGALVDEQDPEFVGGNGKSLRHPGLQPCQQFFPER